MEHNKIICIACEIRVAEKGDVCNQCEREMNEAMSEPMGTALDAPYCEGSMGYEDYEPNPYDGTYSEE